MTEEQLARRRRIESMVGEVAPHALRILTETRGDIARVALFDQREYGVVDGARTAFLRTAARLAVDLAVECIRVIDRRDFEAEQEFFDENHEPDEGEV